MKSWLVSAFLLLLLAGCAADAPQSAPARVHAPRTLTPDREIANPAVKPTFQATDTLAPPTDSVP